MAAFSRKSRLKLLATIFATEFAFGLPLLLAQNASANAASPEQAKKIYAVQCSLCHGAEAHGGEYGPALNGTNDLHGKSAAWLREVIKNGIPAGGMPAFNLPAGELDALASWIESMNMPATQSADARQTARPASNISSVQGTAPAVIWSRAEALSQVRICRALPAE